MDLKPDLVLKYGANGGRYLARWNLKHKVKLLLGLPSTSYHTSCSMLLHHIEGNDPDSALHNHPWPAVAVILWGGYYQRVACKEEGQWVFRQEKVSWFNVLRVNEYHRIVWVRSNTWTITFTGKLLSRGWGFLNYLGQHVDHKDYLHTKEDDQ